MSDAESALPEKHVLRLIINGQRMELRVAPWTTLLDLLREQLHLTGTKKGCDHGQCGACTVLADGRRINACLALAVMQEGVEITTVEGLAAGETLHPVQEAFIEHDAFQCGYCTPGQICSAVGLMNEIGALGHVPAHVDGNGHIATQTAHALADAELRELMSGNLCRCGAYTNIFAAVREAIDQVPARELTGQGGQRHA